MKANGPTGLNAVIFDWAGTMIDHGSRAPIVALLGLFADRGVPITEAEARKDMGLGKWDHIARLLASPRIARTWEKATGAKPAAHDARVLFDAIGPAMTQAARERAALIPGAAQVANDLQRAGVRVGSCTGYPRTVMEAILPRAAGQGYRPDCLVCAGETAHGRPSPLMAWKNLVELGAWPANACVKVDDTGAGIAEGLHAGMWTVGIAASGNEIGLTEQDLAALAPADRNGRLEVARKKLAAAGAHVVIDTVADLPAVLERLPFGSATDALPPSP